MQGRRAGSVDDKDRRRLAALAEAADPQIVLHNENPRRHRRVAGLAAPQRLPRRRGPQRLDHIELGATAQLPAPRAVRTAALAGFLHRARLARRTRATGAGLGLQGRKQASRNGGTRRGEDHFVERAIEIGLLWLIMLAGGIFRRVRRWRLVRLGLGLRIGLRRRRRIGLGLGLRWQDERARRQHHPGSTRDIVLFDLGVSVPGCAGAGDAQRQQRRPQGHDAQRRRRVAQRRGLFVLRRDAGETPSCDLGLFASERKFLGIAHRHVIEVQMQRQPVTQGGGSCFIVDAFIQRDYAEPRRPAQRQAVALDQRLTGIHRRGEMHHG